MKNIAFLLALSCVTVVSITSGERQEIANDLLSNVRQHSTSNKMFAELEATTLLALNSDSTERTMASGTGPLAQVSAMVDMMLIQLASELDALQTSLDFSKTSCTTIINGHRTTQSEALAKTSCINLRETSLKKPMLPHIVSSADDKNDLTSMCPVPVVKNFQRHATSRTKATQELDSLLKFKERAAASHENTGKKFLENLAEFDKALSDVRKIRLIIQSSNLDARARQGDTVALLQLKKSVHPRLMSLIELSHQALTSSSAAGIDRIYDLLYQVRDSILHAKAKLIKQDEWAISNWRNNKIRLNQDIYDKKIEIAETYISEGGEIIKYGVEFRVWSEIMRKQWKNKFTELESMREADYKQVLCDEDQQIFNSDLAQKKLEEQALKAVQVKLVDIGKKNNLWSPKVFNTIQKVSQGVTYLTGKYNIRSRLGRYLINGAQGQATFAAGTGSPNVGEYYFHTNPEDLSYNIFEIKEKVTKVVDGQTVTDFVKSKKWYLAEKDGKVFFTQAYNTKHSNFIVRYDRDKNSMVIQNKNTENTLFVDPERQYIATTDKTADDSRGHFSIERAHYQEIGCYKNKVNHQLNNYMTPSAIMSTDKCYDLCVTGMGSKAWTHFGLTSGSQCFCGTDFWAEEADYKECAGKSCNGREGDLCGALMRTIVFRRLKDNEKKAITVPAKPTQNHDTKTSVDANLYSCSWTGLSDDVASNKQNEKSKDWEADTKGDGHTKFLWCCANKWLVKASAPDRMYTSQKCPSCNDAFLALGNAAQKSRSKQWCCQHMKKSCPTSSPTRKPTTKNPTPVSKSPTSLPTTLASKLKDPKA